MIYKMFCKISVYIRERDEASSATCCRRSRDLRLKATLMNFMTSWAAWKQAYSTQPIWTTGTKSILSAFRVQNVRFVHVERLLDLQRKSILELQTELTDLYIQSQRGSALFGKMFERVSEHIFQVAEVANIFNSINLLAVGKISHLFVSHAKLQNSLRYLEHYLNTTHPDLALLRKDSSYYFRNAKFNAFRYDSCFIILLHVKLTLRSMTAPLSLYTITKIPLPAPTNEVHYTKLSCEYEAVVYSRDLDYYLPIRQLSTLDSSDVIDLSQTNHILKSRRFMTSRCHFWRQGGAKWRNFVDIMSSWA